MPVLNENYMSDCPTWLFDMIHFQISTDSLTHSKHRSQGTNKEVMNQIPALRDCYDPTRVVVVFLSEKKLLSRTT